MTEIVNLPQKMGDMRSGGTVRAIVPQTLDDAYRLAKAVCLSGLAPKGLDKPEAAMVAILHGMEVGMTPMMAMQKIAVINGRPTIWGDGALGLVRGSGLCKYVKEWTEGQGDHLTAWCETHRQNEPEPIKRSFSVADAKRAGLWDKAGPWKQFPPRMLQMRARGFALRDAYADVLGGMYLAEELQVSGDDQPMRNITPPPAPKPAARPPGAPKFQDPAHQAAFDAQAPHDRETGEILPESNFAGYDRWLNDAADRLAAAPDEEQATIWNDEVMPRHEAGEIFPPDLDRLRGLLC